MHWTYEPAMEQGVFPHEGGYTNDPRDPGGPTNWGITIYDARRYWKSDATAADVKAMPKSVAEAIYWPHYAVPLCYDDLPAGPDYAALDYGINSGVSRAAKVMQRLVGMNNVDGVIGPATLAAIGRRDPEALVNAICDERMAFLRSLKTFSAFGKGWTRRVTEVRALALHFADQAKHMAPRSHADANRRDDGERRHPATRGGKEGHPGRRWRCGSRYGRRFPRMGRRTPGRNRRAGARHRRDDRRHRLCDQSKLPGAAGCADAGHRGSARKSRRLKFFTQKRSQS